MGTADLVAQKTPALNSAAASRPLRLGDVVDVMAGHAEVRLVRSFYYQLVTFLFKNSFRVLLTFCLRSSAKILDKLS